MGPFLILILALQLFNTTTLSKILNVPLEAVNSINDKLSDYSLFLPPELPNENDELSDNEDILADIIDITNDDDVPVVETFQDKTELKFRQPIESVNIDYSRNAIVLRFHKNNAKSMMKLNSMQGEKKKSLQDNFIRFGKRSYEEFPKDNHLVEDVTDNNHGMRSERSHENARDARGDNFMRFGRSGTVQNDFMRFGRGSNDFMRFGRSPSQDFMRFGRAAGSDNFMRFGRAAGSDNFMRFGRPVGSDNFMRLGRSAGQDFMRFGRTPNQDYMRFGRTPTQDFMRFGRTPSKDFMRFGRTPSQDFMRFGRAGQENFMRFGRNTIRIPANTNFMRYSRPDNFMRFGRTPTKASDSFMRFGKSMEKLSDKNNSQPLMDKNELKQAVKLIHEADKNNDNENPVDKAIKVLFDKHQQPDTTDKGHNDELYNESSHQHNDRNDLESDMDYFLKGAE